jgi:uncharacterized membrane protein
MGPKRRRQKSRGMRIPDKCYHENYVFLTYHIIVSFNATYKPRVISSNVSMLFAIMPTVACNMFEHLFSYFQAERNRIVYMGERKGTKRQKIKDENIRAFPSLVR